MSRDESVGVRSQCARCDQARSCWIRDTLEGRDVPEPNTIAVEVVDLIQDKVLLTGDYHYVARIMERGYGEGPFNIAMGLFTDLPKEGT